MYNYLYLIQDKKDINLDIYKIGKTTQLPDQRFKGYINGTYPIRISKVDDCHKRENELINIFKNKYKIARGREYFIGNINNIIIDFTNFCNNLLVTDVNTNKEKIICDLDIHTDKKIIVIRI